LLLTKKKFEIQFDKTETVDIVRKIGFCSVDFL